MDSTLPWGLTCSNVLACLDARHPAGHQNLHFGRCVACTFCVASHQFFQRQAVADQGFGYANEFQKPSIPNHQPQLVVEQGDALVDVVDCVVQAAQAERHRLAGMAQQVGQATGCGGVSIGGLVGVGSRCRECPFFLPHLHQRRNAKTHEPRQRAHHVQRTGDGKTGHALVAQVDPHVDALAHGGRVRGFFRGDAVFIECALHDALRHGVCLADACTLARRHDAPRLAHKAADQA